MITVAVALVVTGLLTGLAIAAPVGLTDAAIAAATGLDAADISGKSGLTVRPFALAVAPRKSFTRDPADATRDPDAFPEFSGIATGAPRSRDAACTDGRGPSCDAAPSSSSSSAAVGDRAGPVRAGDDTLTTAPSSDGVLGNDTRAVRITNAPSRVTSDSRTVAPMSLAGGSGRSAGAGATGLSGAPLFAAGVGTASDVARPSIPSIPAGLSSDTR